jgi:hypothetical protein
MTDEFRVLRKPYESAVVKSFRINILRNKAFPNPPADGWITPSNWYTRFDDLVRGTLVCRFLDGPKLLAGALGEYAGSLGLDSRHVPRSTDDGYYAFHQYTRFPAEVVDADWETQETKVELEIQLTTQLQEVLRELTHPLYEEARIATARRDDGWKWDHDSPRFRTSYLGHTLHMIEAVIVQVRDSRRGEPQPAGEAPPPPVPEAPKPAGAAGDPPVAQAAAADEAPILPVPPEMETRE